MAIKRTSIFRGKIIDVDVETVELPNGRIMELEVVRHPGGAAAVALDDQNRVCLLRQYRQVAGDWLWELPAGKLDPGESPLATARRELEEEAGIRAHKWETLGSHISSPAIFTEIIHLFLARELEGVETSHEVHELIEVHWLPFSEALAWARSGAIRDAKTLIGLFQAGARVSLNPHIS